MNETTKNFFLNNTATFIVTIIAIFISIFSFILNLRSDIDATQIHVQALEQSNTSLVPLIPEVAKIQQLSQDTNDKVTTLYTKVFK